MKKNYNFQKDEKLIIREKEKLHQITVSDIATIHSESGISTIKKINNEKIVVAKNLSFFEKELAELDFIRANRNELINCACILNFNSTNKHIELCNNRKIKISRRNIRHIHEKLFKRST